MRTIEIAANHPGRAYARDCLENGHVPGVLSGANLQGTAKKYGRGYARSRENLTVWLEDVYDVTNELVLMNAYGDTRRWCRVWVDVGSGERVQLVVA